MDLGVKTYGCCCGHGIDAGMINVDEESAKIMFELGYEYYPNIPERNWKFTFLSKSKHVGK